VSNKIQTTNAEAKEVMIIGATSNDGLFKFKNIIVNIKHTKPHKTITIKKLLEDK
jgi:formylmethanofuran dehydrogenase subunit D